MPPPVDDEAQMPLLQAPSVHASRSFAPVPAPIDSFDAMMREATDKARTLAALATTPAQAAVARAATRFATELEVAAAAALAESQGADDISIAIESPRGSIGRCGGLLTSLCDALYGLYQSAKVPVLFFSVGIIVYNLLEGWAPGDTVYYLIVTSTTVGYGDIFPKSPLGKLFTCVYAVIGITVVLGTLAPLVAILQGEWREKLLECICGKGVDTRDMSLSMDEINARMKAEGGYGRRYALALLSPLAVLLSGMALHWQYIREPPDFTAGEDPVMMWLGELAVSFLGHHSGVAHWLKNLELDVVGFIDSFYWTVITMTTIGYGDICPRSGMAKMLAVIYLPMAVIALADAISDVGMIGRRRSIRETDFGMRVDECLLRDAVRDGECNVHPKLSEAEFLTDQLIANKLVDEEAVLVLKRQFKYLTRRGTFESDEDRQLNAQLVYEELAGRVAEGKVLSDGASEHDLTPEGNFKWKSFEAWFERSWKVRVVKAAGSDLNLAQTGRQELELKTALGAASRGR